MERDLTKGFSGNFQKVSINLTEPKMNVQNIEMNKITLMAGQNGVGKSFLNKTMWALLFFANAMCLKNMHGAQGELNPAFDDNDLMQFIMDNTFDEQNFQGKIKFYTEEPILGTPEEYVEVTFEDGKVTVDYDMLDVTDAPTPVYMSTSTRKFSALDNYLMIKDLQGIKDLETFNDIKKLCKSFKLYEIFAIEKVLAKLDTVSEVLGRLMEMSPELAEEIPSITKMYIKDNKIVADIDEPKGIDGQKTRTVSALSDGHQALLMMFMTTI